MPNQPNIVLITWDSVRADHLPTYGYSRETAPTLATMAEGGLVFDDAYVPAVGTPASFSGTFSGCQVTGSMEHPYPEHWQQAIGDRRLLPEALQDAGYHTGGFHFNALMSGQFGWNRGWDVYEDHLWTEGEHKGVESGWKKSVYDHLQRANLANLVLDAKRMVQGQPPVKWEALWNEVESFVAQAPEPFFLWVLLIDTHHPYYAPEEHQEWDQPGIRTMYALNYLMRRYRGLVGERRESIVNAYDNTIRYADAFLERLRDTLAREGHGDAPLIVHSDHGDELGEHANYGHRPLMYDTVTRVPLVMENVEETGRISGPVSLLDLGSTILELARSRERLADRPSLLEAERQPREYVMVQNRLKDDELAAAVVSENWKVLFHPAGDWGAKWFPESSWEAYHRGDDPGERSNRWGDHPEELENVLRGRLQALAPSIEASDAMSEHTRERLRELGYIE